ncbi:MAG: NUDIX domain-containing protein [Solirubrobacterales bacterium]
MERIGGRLVHRGKIFSVREDTFRLSDGETSEREWVVHSGAVAIAAHDEEKLFMVRQPREAVGEDALLELPAGKLDVEGETRLEAAQRELAEEIGCEASEWRELKRFYTSPGFASEEVTVFEATGLAEVPQNLEEDERIEIIEVKLDELDAAFERCNDAKSLIGITLLRESMQ